MATTFKKGVTAVAAASLVAALGVAGALPSALAATSDPSDLVAKAQADTERAVALYNTIETNDLITGTVITQEQLKQSTPPAYNEKTRLSQTEIDKAINATNAVRAFANVGPVAPVPAGAKVWEDAQLGSFAMTKQQQIEHGLREGGYRSGAPFTWFTEGGSTATANAVLSIGGQRFSAKYIKNPAPLKSPHIQRLMDDRDVPNLVHRLQLLRLDWKHTAMGASAKVDLQGDKWHLYNSFDMITLTSNAGYYAGAKADPYLKDDILSRTFVTRADGTADTAWPSPTLPFPQRLVPTDDSAWSYTNPKVQFNSNTNVRVFRNGAVENNPSRRLIAGNALYLVQGNVPSHATSTVSFNPQGANDSLKDKDYKLYLVQIDGASHLKLVPGWTWPSAVIDTANKTPFHTQYLVRIIKEGSLKNAPTAANIHMEYTQDLPANVNINDGDQEVKYTVNGVNSDVHTGAEYVLQLQQQVPGSSTWTNIGDPAIYRGEHSGSFKIPATTAVGTKYRLVATDYNGEIASQTTTVVKQSAPAKLTATSALTQSVLQGKTAKPFTVSVTPKDAGIKWQQLNGSTWEDVKPAASGTSFAPADTAKAGTFKYRAIATDGSNSSVEFTLTVTPKRAVKVYVPDSITTTVGVQPELPQTLRVEWDNGDITEEPVTWPAVNVSEPGTQTLHTTLVVDGKSIPIDMELKVVAAQMVKLFVPVSVTTPSGTPPQLPQQLKAEFNNGTTQNVAVEWSSSKKYMDRKGGSYTVTGTVAGWRGDTPTVTVNVTPATATQIAAPAAITVVQGATAQLPKSVKVTWSNGDVTDEAVAWPTVNTDKVGTETVTSSNQIDGKALTIKVTVTAAQITSVDEPQTITVPSGTAPQLPSELTVHYNNGKSGKAPVTWTSSDAYKNREGGSYKLTGTVLGWKGTAPIQNVIVTPATVTAVQRFAPITVKQDMPVALPSEAKVTWSNGDVTSSPVTWPAVSTNKVGTQTITARDQINGISVTITVNVVAAEISKVADLPEITVPAGVRPQLPATAQVTYDNNKTANVEIIWSKMSDKWRDRQGGEFTVTGILKGTDRTVTQQIRVTPAFIIKVADLPLITVNAGGKLELPREVAVTYSDGTTENAAITWGFYDSQVLNNRLGGEFKVTGTVANGSRQVIQTVHVNPATVKEIAKFNPVTVTQGMRAQLPQAAKVTWSNGEVTDEAVAWPTVKTDSIGEQTIKSTNKVAGQQLTITVKVVAPTISEVVAPKPVTTDSGTAPQLPTEVVVKYNNGTTGRVAVKWSDSDAYMKREGGSYELTGTVAGWKGAAPRITVKVHRATVTKVAATEPVTTVVDLAPKLPQTLAVTWSNGETTMEKVNWDRVDVSQVGKKVVEGKVAGEEITIEVIVKAASITAIANPAGVTTDFGIAPQLPQTLTAKYDNGKSADVQVTWSNSDAYKTERAGGKYTLTGTVAGWSGKAPVITVTVNPAQISKIIAPQAVTTTVAVAPKLPQTVQVVWADGATTEERVTWPQVNVAVAGDQTITGSVADHDVEITVHVLAPVITAIADPAAVTTDSGTEPVLPFELVATLNNGKTEKVKVDWSSSEAYRLREGGDYVLTGTVAGWDGRAPQIRVHVKPATVTFVEPLGTVTTTVGVAPTLPQTVNVNWSNGDITQVGVSWPSVDVSKAGTQLLTATNKVNGEDVTVLVEVVDAVPTSVAKLDPVKTVVFEQPELPKTVEVKWNNGTTTEEPIAWPTVDVSKVGGQTVTGEVAGQSVSVKLTVTGVSGKVTAANGQTAISKVQQGDSVKVFAYGFVNGQVNISLNNGAVTLGGAFSADGVAEAVVTIPEGAKAGMQQLTITQGKRVVTLPLEVTAIPKPAEPSEPSRPSEPAVQPSRPAQPLASAQPTRPAQPAQAVNNAAPAADNPAPVAGESINNPVDSQEPTQAETAETKPADKPTETKPNAKAESAKPSPAKGQAGSQQATATDSTSKTWKVVGRVAIAVVSVLAGGAYILSRILRSIL